MLCSRQVGKSTISSAIALLTALLTPAALILLLSPSLRQSSELFRKVLDLFNALGRPVGVVNESALRLELVNGSRVISLPGNEGNIRGFSSVRLLIIDEAARVADALFYACRPMLAVSGGRLICLSSAYAQQGFFYREWQEGKNWERVKIRAAECSRISPEFLAEERAVLGETWFAMEYEGVFVQAVDALYRVQDIEAAISDDVQPLYLR